MKKSAGIFAYLAIAASIVLEVTYGAWRLHVHFNAVPLWMFRIVITGAVVYVFAMFIAVFKFPNRYVRLFGIVAGYLAAFLPFMTFSLAVTHLLVLMVSVSLFWSGVAALTVAFSVVVVGAVLGNMVVVRETIIPIAKLRQELTILQISDAHIGVLYGKSYLSKIVDKANAQNPDVVVITGDLTETKAALGQGMLTPLANIQAPSYFVEGNHESFPGLNGVLDVIRQQNVRILHNEIVETHGIQLIGLDYMKADEHAYDMHAPKNNNTVKSVFSDMEIKPDVPVIVLSHNPTGVNYITESGAALMISGHTHKGQVFPFTLITKMAFDYHGGLYDNGKMKVFVSGGVGGVITRMRLGSFNEINLLRLVPESGSGCA